MGQTMKVSGQVVGPEEVEAALRAHPCVAEVCVFAEPDPVLGDRPVAVVELGPGWVPGESLAHELQLLAREHLARFAYPRRVVFEEFPRNTSGKIDRSATKERFAERG
jgi:acyl-coenzyme A synthetase/AMP-(fatty) acid ligase